MSNVVRIAHWVIEMLFQDRRDAGRRLAAELGHVRLPNAVVLALPRGGVPVGYEVARSLRAPLDVFVVRKLGVPGFEELAMGAVASGGVCVLNPDVIERFEVTPDTLDAVVARECLELERRIAEYGGRRGPPTIRDRTALLVDDGLATGATMRAAAIALRAFGPKQIVAVVPVAAPASLSALRDWVDDVVCVTAPDEFESVGAYYVDFKQTTDAEVRDLLPRGRFDVDEISASVV